MRFFTERIGQLSVMGYSRSLQGWMSRKCMSRFSSRGGGYAFTSWVEKCPKSQKNLNLGRVKCRRTDQIYNIASRLCKIALRIVLMMSKFLPLMCVYVTLLSPTWGSTIICFHSSLIYPFVFSEKRPKRRKNCDLGQIKPETRITSSAAAILQDS